MATWSDNSSVDDVVHDRAKNVLEFMKCKHFVSLYLEIIKNDKGRGIFNNIMPYKEKELQKLTKMKPMIIDNLSLESFLVDSDIKYLYV